jgi:hypothetical protein
MNSFGLAALALIVLASAARAQPAPCTELRSTDVPFAVDFEVKTVALGKSEVAPRRHEQRQVFRRGRETVSYVVQTPARYLRTRGINAYLPTEYLYSTNPPARTQTYSIDTSVDYLARRQPLEFASRMTGADGHVFLDARIRLDFVGTGTVDVGGCTFEVVKIMQTLNGTAERAPISNSGENWMSPELRVPLYSKLTAGGTELTYTAVAISKDFNRVE